MDEATAAKVKKECDGKTLKSQISTRKNISRIRDAVNLTDLQVEAHKLFKITPKETQAIAQELYLGAYISYPRTSSQKLKRDRI